MATLADSLVSSSARALPMRIRADLTATQQRYQGRVYWVLKDPVGLNYFRLQEEEYAILKMLDGQASLDQIKRRFERQFPPQKITVEELGQFIGTLHRSSLVVTNVPGQGIQLKKRYDKRRRQEWLAALSNILSVRFKGIDPDRLLNWLHPRFKWMYSRFAVTCCLMLGLAALTLVTVQFDVFRGKLPSFHEFFTARNWVFLAATLGITKVVHEFGHGLTCKHYGGECHEMGVMFLVLTPCLYCNVSDSWMLPNKWHRAYIGAAGMYIEIVMASICTFLWWFSEPGLLNQLCLSTMFVCSVSTVMFNANPLLRYDGYYILSDLSEIPNLRQKATSIMSRKLSSWCLGMEEPEDPFLPQRNQAFFALYSVAAGIYRWVVLVSILWFLYHVLEPYGLKVLSQMITIASVATMIAQPAWQLGKYFSVPGRWDQVKQPRLRITAGVLAVLLAGVLFIPLPYRVLCHLDLQPRASESVYVDIPGLLTTLYVKAGDKVVAGDVLAKLTDDKLAMEIESLKGDLAGREAHLDSLQALQFDDQRAAELIPGAEEDVAGTLKQYQKKKEDIERLMLKARTAGVVLPPPETPDQSERGQLPSWHGSPLEKRNLGAFLQQGTLFCQIGDPTKMEAVLVIDQDDIDFVEEGQTVDIKLDELPHTTFRTTIEQIASNEMEHASRALSAKSGGEMETITDKRTGREKPLNTSYQARAAIDEPDGKLFVGLSGRGKVYARPQTLGTRLWRYLTRTFNFKL